MIYGTIEHGKHSIHGLEPTDAHYITEALLRKAQVAYASGAPTLGEEITTLAGDVLEAITSPIPLEEDPQTKD